MINETSPLIITLNTIQRISHTLLGLHDPEKLNAAVIDLQSAIVDSLRQAIAIQQSYVALEIKARDLVHRSIGRQLFGIPDRLS